MELKYHEAYTEKTKQFVPTIKIAGLTVQCTLYRDSYKVSQNFTKIS